MTGRYTNPTPSLLIPRRSAVTHTAHRHAPGGSDQRSAELIVVANRLPVHYDDRAGQWSRSPGGLVTALHPVLASRNGSWIGWNNGPGHVPTDPEVRLVGVRLTTSIADGYYHGFANRTLWPAMHDMGDRIEQRDSWWRSYQEANRLFAAAVVATAAPGAIVWIHDYHLLLVPELIARHRPDITIGVFLHTPVPEATTISRLEHGNELMAGLAAATLIGTQRCSDAARLAEALEQAGHQGAGRRCRIETHPISVDVEQIRSMAHDPGVTALAARVRSRAAAGRRILLGVDRMDYTKGIPERLRAYEQLLALGLVDPDDTVFIQIASPSRLGVPAYRRFHDEVTRLVSSINAAHTSPRGQAVILISHALSFREVCAHYLAADTAVVTPHRDGMNLVAKEFVTARAGDDVALVLSRGAGAADALGEHATLVEPASTIDLAAGIMHALALPAPDRARASAAMADVVAANDVHRWATTFLDSLRGQRDAEIIDLRPAATGGPSDPVPNADTARQ